MPSDVTARNPADRRRLSRVTLGAQVQVVTGDPAEILAALSARAFPARHRRWVWRRLMLVEALNRADPWA